ncbi:MAG: hypothetical protein SFY69_00215 [Planctomycetota bacterium]|nr:hypothetical protein [Planctomycetota bacterium]
MRARARSSSVRTVGLGLFGSGIRAFARQAANGATARAIASRLAATACAVSIVAGALGGCSPAVKSHGQSGLEATYSARTLSAVLPASARIPAVVAAAEDTVRARGYAVVRADATEELGTLVARPPRTSDYPVLELTADLVPNGTRVRLVVKPFGDQEMSRSILDGTLQRLGM